MNITPQSMEETILRNMSGADPHLKKLLAELNSLKAEIYGDKTKKNKEPKKEPLQELDCSNNNSANERKKQARKRRIKETSMFVEVRKSERLSGNSPKYNFIDDIDELENQMLFSNGKLNVSKERFYTRSLNRRQHDFSDRVILKPEEVTAEMLNNICINSTEKIYDKVNGSSCHQCRQKTLDTKTICRNMECFGVRGQFCGPCAKNRYGVDVAEALMDPYWSCFVCLGVCNCSFCRSRQGKRPTGILAPIAKREGYESVKEFLDALRMKIPEEDDYNEFMRDPESVLGFSDYNTVCTVGGNEKIVNAAGTEFRQYILSDIIDCIENNSSFSGFSTDTVKESTLKLSKLNSIIQLLSMK